MPWKYPLHKIVVRPEYREVAALLLQDGLVSQRTLDLATSAVASMATSLDVTHVEQMLSAAPVLSAFGQEFDYRFGVNSGCLCLFASADAIYRQYTRRIASFWAAAGPDRVGKRREYSPFEGSAICCFERSTLPEHAGKRVIVIRINRFVDNDPIRDVPAPDGRVYPIEELRPREGELLKVMLPGKVGPWAVDVDKEWKRKIPRGRILRVLFENEELYGSPLQSRI
ncbi:hypothetical protein LXA43DRAFT_1036693 [Ganoderma leucocontextum]|nr:hypothetical protein LXA43DRAFT_1036693 [Ganoderma leucocontextum]